MNTSIVDYAGLTCRVIDDLDVGATPELVVVLCHGYGASGADLADFGPHLIQGSPKIAQRCRFVFPEAPQDLTPLGMPGGRAWWPINMAQLAEAQQTRSYEVLTTVEPDGLQEASEQLANAVKEIQEASGVDDSSTVMGGFSQGAMVSTDVVLRRKLTPAQLVIFSGTLLCRDDWTRMAQEHSGCAVLQSHGKQDVVLPYAPSEWLRDMLSDNGFTVDFQPFNGPHTIPMRVLQNFAATLIGD